MKKKTIILAIFLCIFCLGAFTGVVGHKLYRKSQFEQRMKHPPSRENMIDRRLKYMSRKLDLKEAQIEQIKVILLDTRKQIDDLKLGVRPLIHQVLETETKKIKQILNEDQWLEFQKILKNRSHHLSHSPPPM